MWSESHFVDIFFHDTKSEDWKVLMSPGLFSRMEVCLLSTELEVQGFAALRILRESSECPGCLHGPGRVLGRRACAGSTLPL